MATRTAKNKNRTALRRRPGRPRGEAHSEAIRAALLKAARQLFAQRDFKAAPVREIAAAARVNPAMIHYHFGDKDGLYRAMLQETMGPVLQKVQELMNHSSGRPAGSIHDALEAVMTMLAREPWVARLIVREVLAEEGPFRELFIREFAARGGGRVPQLLEREMAQGRVRKDLDPVLGALSFISMALFPFIALPVAEKLFGVRLTDAFTRRLVEHSTRLFYEGVGSNVSHNTARRNPVAAAGRGRRTT
ncbi:MAG: TetR/AcrR family transcriptional regulator [Pseudomonadota bacterium]